MKKINKDTLYMTVIGLSVTILIVSNIASTKMFDFFGTGLVWNGGVVLFPFAYVLGDAITEIYGFKKARNIVLLTIAMNLLAVLVLWIVQILPPGPGWENQAAYEAIIGFMPRIVFGSVTAYTISQILNSFIFAKIKNATKGRFLLFRAIASNMVSKLIDVAIFISIAFYGTITTEQFFGLIVIAYTSKIIFGTVLTPVTYLLIKFMKKITGLDHYDKKLSLGNIFTR